MAIRSISGRSLTGRLIDGRALGLRVSGGGVPGISVTTPPSPPTIEWDEDDADSTPDFDIILWSGLGAPQDTAVDDVLRMQYSTDSGGNWNAYLTHTFTSDDIAGTPFTVSGVSALGTGSYLFRARIERGALLSDWSATAAVNLDTPPAITSSNTASVSENSELAHALTSNEVVTWSIVGGADELQFDITGSTLTWAADGSQDYEAPADANADNTYVVTVRATDLTTHTTDQTITVSVTDVDDTVASASGIGWPWLWIPSSSGAGETTGAWMWLLKG